MLIFDEKLKNVQNKRDFHLAYVIYIRKISFFCDVLCNKGRIPDVSFDRKLYQLDSMDIYVQSFFYSSTKPFVNMYLIFHRDL